MFAAARCTWSASADGILPTTGSVCPPGTTCPPAIIVTKRVARNPCVSPEACPPGTTRSFDWLTQNVCPPGTTRSLRSRVSIKSGSLQRVSHVHSARVRPAIIVTKRVTRTRVHPRLMGVASSDQMKSGSLQRVRTCTAHVLALPSREFDPIEDPPGRVVSADRSHSRQPKTRFRRHVRAQRPRPEATERRGGFVLPTVT